MAINRTLILAIGVAAAAGGVIYTSFFANAKTPETVKAQDAVIANGKALYLENCASCHGTSAKGGLGSDLTDNEWTRGGLDSDIRTVIQNGIEDMGMPGYGDTLSGDDQDAIISFIRASSSTVAVKAVTDVASVQDQVQVEEFLTGFKKPWAIQFLTPTSGLVTQKGGKLRQFKDGRVLDADIKGIPDVTDRGQGGLLDVAIDPDYADNGWVYLSFSHPLDGKKSSSMTKVVRGKIEGNTWMDEETLWQAKDEDYINTGYHFGSRIVFDDDGHLYFSIGDRGKQDMAQDITRPNGKIHRIMRDGSIPADNPFVDEASAYPSIYSYGNRNPQGLAYNRSTQTLWSTEHGPKGGDELNVIRSGENYGWPVISYGINYNGTELTPYTQMEGMTQPVSHWTPSIAVCGLDIYTGDMFPDWKGRLLAGALSYAELRLIDVEDGNYVDQTTLLSGKGRVRDVSTGPDGAIYVVTDSGTIWRLSPL